MKSTERFAAILVAIITAACAYQTIAVLPYRVDQNEKHIKENSEKISVEMKEIRMRADAEKEKLEQVRESLIRIEERVKGVQVTVDEMSRRQRFSTSTAESN